MPRLAALSFLTLVIAAVVVLVTVEHFVSPVRRGAPIAAQSVSNRPRLSVCVEGTRGLTATETDLEAVRQALTALRAEFGTEKTSEPGVVSGCPQARVLSEAAPRTDDERSNLLSDPIGIRSPDLPNSNRAFVYILPADIYAEYFGATRWAIAPAEMYCSGHSCAEVSTSVYISADSSENDVYESLKRALGLYVYPPSPTPDFTVCLQSEPPRWCSQFPPGFLPGGP